MLTEWYKYRTHCEVTGTSQSGKSKFAEYSMREHVMDGNGFCLVDWHGTLYQEVLQFLALVQPDRPVSLINPSEPQHITPFNPFKLRPGDDITAHAIRLADVLVKPWGEENTNELPTYERIVKMVLTFMAVSGEPLHHAAKLLEYPKKELREYAISLIEDDYMQQQWKQLQYVGSFREWTHEVQSTQNRLARFIGSKGVKLFTGLKGEGLDIDRAVSEGAIILVNLKPSPSVAPESGRVFASLILSEFFHSALKHASEERPYFLYLDECQNYLTSDAAKMLDQVPKTGLRLTLIHHHMGQFAGNVPLIESLRTNAQIKVVFAGLPPDRAREAAEEFFMPELNERWKKDDRIHYVTRHYEDYDESVTETDYGDAQSVAVRRGTRLVPFVERILDGQDDYTMEEKISKLAQRFMELKTRECYIKLPDDAFKWLVPWVEGDLLDADTVIRFNKATQPNAISIHDAENILKEQERAFLERSKTYVSRGARPKKRPPALHPQE